jgi:hypothetical protein
VVYFHHPRFCRKPQLDLAKIPESPLTYHMLPLVMQLLPEIPLFYDDDSRIPGLTHGPVEERSKGGWIWLVCCSAIFLVDVTNCAILAHPQLSVLVAYYLRSTKTSISASDADGVDENGEPTTFSSSARAAQATASATPFSHVQLL